MGSNSGLSGCYKSYTFGLSASQPIIGQGEYFELFASFINFSSMSPKDGCLDKIKCTFPDSVRNECGFVSCREKILLPVCSLCWAACGQIPVFRVPSAAQSGLRDRAGGAGSFNQHLGPCFTNSVVPLPISKLSTRPAQHYSTLGLS